MGASGMGDKLSRFVKEHYPDSKSDLFAVFIEKGNEWVKENAFNCMVTMQSWMFLSSFEKMRQSIIQNKTIRNMVHMPYLGKGGTSLGINFGTAAVVFNNFHVKGYKAQYGADVGFKVESFDHIEIDGYPGYKIVAKYEPEGSQVVHQTVYIIRSKYRTFTITYQRAADDDCEESFNISASTIRVH